VVESWSVRSIQIRASLQYSSTTILRSRVFLTFCALLFALCPAATAQQPTKISRIGYLAGPSLSSMSVRTEAFRQGLRELGYVEGKNIVLESRYSEEKIDRLLALVAEFVRLKADVIVTRRSY